MKLKDEIVQQMIAEQGETWADASIHRPAFPVVITAGVSETYSSENQAIEYDIEAHELNPVDGKWVVTKRDLTPIEIMELGHERLWPVGMIMPYGVGHRIRAWINNGRQRGWNISVEKVP